MAIISVCCRFCGQSNPVRKHGKGYAGYPRFRCLDCRKSFQLEYAYEAHKPGTREKIVDMAMNGSIFVHISRGWQGKQSVFPIRLKYLKN